MVEYGDGGAADGFGLGGFVEDAGEGGVGVFEVPAGVGEGRGHEGGNWKLKIVNSTRGRVRRWPPGRAAFPGACLEGGVLEVSSG